MSEAGASREGTARRGGGGELTSFTSARSSASVHSSLLTEGHTWLCHLHARRKVLRKERKCRAREMTMAVGVGYRGGAQVSGALYRSLHCLLALPGSLLAIKVHDCGPLSFTCGATPEDATCAAYVRHGCGTLWLYMHVHMLYTCTCSFQHILHELHQVPILLCSPRLWARGLGRGRGSV